MSSSGSATSTLFKNKELEYIFNVVVTVLTFFLCINMFVLVSYIRKNYSINKVLDAVLVTIRDATLSKEERRERVDALCAARPYIDITKIFDAYADFPKRNNASIIRYVMENDYPIEHISLSLCRQGTIESVIAGIEHNASVKVLKFRWPITLDDDTIVRLARGLRSNSSLKELWIEISTIGRSGYDALGDMLRHTTSLEKLKMEKTGMEDYGAEVIADALKTNTSLRVLDIDTDDVGPIGAKAFADALKQNSSLEKLGILGEIGDEGACAIADALKQNTALVSLDVSSTTIGTKGTVAIADTLRVNHSLHNLYMSSCKVRNGGTVALASAMESNMTLTTLKLPVFYHMEDADDDDDEQRAEIEGYLQRNKELPRFRRVKAAR